jgi:hypothetical protein
MKRKPRVQECRKRFDKFCFVCGEADYALLDAHRILPGAKGGQYHWLNLLTLCSKCHRKVDAGRLVIHGRYQSTLGRYVIHYTLDGEERWEGEDKWEHLT